MLGAAMTVAAAQPRPERGLSETGCRGLAAGTHDRVSGRDPDDSPTCCEGEKARKRGGRREGCPNVYLRSGVNDAPALAWRALAICVSCLFHSLRDGVLGKLVRAHRGREKGLNLSGPLGSRSLHRMGKTRADASGSGPERPKNIGSLGHVHMRSTGQPRTAASAHGRVALGCSCPPADPTMHASLERGMGVDQTKWVERSAPEDFRLDIGETDGMRNKSNEEVKTLRHGHAVLR